MTLIFASSIFSTRICFVALIIFISLILFTNSYAANKSIHIFIAEHGSWNRSKPIGYRITRVILNGKRPIRYETFAEGWLQGEKAWGRPVDVLVMPDGALLVSDDRAGAIYRVSYKSF